MTMLIFPLLLQKPSLKSKAKDHAKHLERRLALWKDGDIHKLVKECTTIQSRLKTQKADQNHHIKVFTRLMLQGKISSALRWVGKQRNGVLDVDDEVIATLQEKHPNPGEVHSDALLNGPAFQVYRGCDLRQY